MHQDTLTVFYAASRLPSIRTVSGPPVVVLCTLGFFVGAAILTAALSEHAVSCSEDQGSYRAVARLVRRKSELILVDKH